MVVTAQPLFKACLLLQAIAVKPLRHYLNHWASSRKRSCFQWQVVKSFACWKALQRKSPRPRWLLWQAVVLVKFMCKNWWLQKTCWPQWKLPLLRYRNTLRPTKNKFVKAPKNYFFIYVHGQVTLVGSIFWLRNAIRDCRASYYPSP